MYNYKKMIKNINLKYKLKEKSDNVNFDSIIDLLKDLFDDIYYHDKLNNGAVFIGKYNVVVKQNYDIIEISIIDMKDLVIKDSFIIKDYYIYTSEFLFWSKKEFYTEERLLKIIYEYISN